MMKGGGWGGGGGGGGGWWGVGGGGVGGGLRCVRGVAWGRGPVLWRVRAHEGTPAGDVRDGGRAVKTGKTYGIAAMAERRNGRGRITQIPVCVRTGLDRGLCFLYFIIQLIN